MNATSTLDQAVEFADNPEPRVAVVVVVDTSGSMDGAPINALNAGMAQLKADLLQDSLASKRVEIAVLEFNSSVNVAQDFVTPDAFMPTNLSAGGSTEMGAGILKAFDMVEARKAEYRTHGVAYYRPWIFLITDGAPTDDTGAAEQRVKDAEAAKRVAFFAVGVDGADMSKLAAISIRPPVKLTGLNFSKMFEWLSRSLQSVATSQPGDQVALPAVGWGKV